MMNSFIHTHEQRGTLECDVKLALATAETEQKA